ncbi:unnamed protein product [Aphanomyces euteiches]
MTTERTWLDDLHLLIATDEQLQQELATVCELFDSDDSLSTVTDTTRRPETTTTAQSTDDDNGATKRKKRKPTYIRQQEEIRQLRQQVDHLTALLRARQTTDERTPPSEILPSWRKTAQSELAMKNKTLQENQHLRHAVGQHATFIEQMQQFFHKKPRLSVRFTLACSSYKLAAQASLRRAAIHAIADRQYHRMQSAMVQAGVFNCEKTLFTARAKRQPDQSYVVEIIHNIELDAPFRVVGAAAWRVFKGDFDFDLPLGADQTFTRMDPNTVYATFVQETSDCMECHSNMIRKHYREREMEVIVSRTVLDDAAVPYMTKGEIENRSMWLRVLPLSSDATRCRFTLLQHLIWPRDEMTLAESDMALVLHEIQHVCFVSTPQQRRGMLPVAAPIDLSHLPFPKMATFVERGRRFVRLLKGKINDAIQAYQDQRSLARIES